MVGSSPKLPPSFRLSSIDPATKRMQSFQRNSSFYKHLNFFFRPAQKVAPLGFCPNFLQEPNYWNIAFQQMHFEKQQNAHFSVVLTRAAGERGNWTTGLFANKRIVRARSLQTVVSPTSGGPLQLNRQIFFSSEIFSSLQTNLTGRQVTWWTLDIPEIDES